MLAHLRLLLLLLSRYFNDLQETPVIGFVSGIYFCFIVILFTSCKSFMFLAISINTFHHSSYNPFFFLESYGQRFETEPVNIVVIINKDVLEQVYVTDANFRTSCKLATRIINQQTGRGLFNPFIKMILIYLSRSLFGNTEPHFIPNLNTYS